MQLTSRLKKLHRSCQLIADLQKAGCAQLGILVTGADHLREVDQYSIARLSLDEDVELIEVAMNQAGSS